MKKINAIVATVVSAVSGALIGILFAPDKGSSTREKLSKESDEYLQKLKAELDEIRRSLKKRVDQTREEVDDIRKSAREEVDEIRSEAKNKGEHLVDKAQKLTSYDEWTKEELYERAKELSIDGYSQMNKDELINALRNR